MPKKFFDIIPPERVTVVSKGDSHLKVTVTPKKRIFLKSLIFCLALLVLVGVAGFFFFSKVEIEIWPETEILSFKETVIIDLNAEHADLEAKIIPGKVFSDQKFTSQEFSASGKILKEEKATGIIRVYNAYSTSARTLIPSRFVSAEGKLFRSVKKIIIPGGRYEKGKFIPGEMDVGVQAAEAGPDYNIEPTTFALPALAGTSLYTAIYGRSFSPMTGGFKGEVSQVTQEDLEKAENVLAEELKKESREFLKSTLPTDFVLLDGAISQEIVEIDSSVEAGAGVESFNLQIKVKSEGLGFKRLDIENFVKNCISLDIPEGKKIQEESLEINYSSESINLESGEIVLNLDIKVKVYSDIDLTKLKKALLGKSFKEAEVFLKDLPQVTKVEIKSWPFLKKKIPEDINKVEIGLRID